MRSLLQESKERELKLQAELAECKRSSRVLDLERELEVKKSELDGFVRKVELLEEEKSSISEQLSALTSISGREKNYEMQKVEENEGTLMAQTSSSLEMEVVELRRLNKELQLQKRNLACRLSSVESQLASLPKSSEVSRFL